MIKLTKGTEPHILTANKMIWTTELLRLKSLSLPIPDSLESNYNQPDVRDALRLETGGHCMYCQSSISHIAYEHIEHIKPKALNKYPELTFEWNNLGLACQKCNTLKGNEYDENLAFVNPYTENPNDFFQPLGANVHHKPANLRGEYTIIKVQLNRPGLIERRQERIQIICNLIDKYTSAQNNTFKKAILSQIKIEIADNKPFSLFTKSFAKAMLGKSVSL